MFDAELFCANISKLRRDADMTQSELADKLNITRQAVSRYEKGDSFPDISVLVKIAEIFGISIDELIGAGCPHRGRIRNSEKRRARQGYEVLQMRALRS